MRKFMAFVVVLLAVSAVATFRSHFLTKGAQAAPDIPNRILALELTGKVYRLSSASLTPLPIAPDSFVDQKSPIISPDQQWVAYLRSNDVWLFNATSGENRQLTNIARPATEKLLPVEVLLLGWSPDSHRVLYQVIPGAEECEDCQPRQPTPVDYGFFSYTMANGRVTPVPLPHEFDFRAWLPDDRFLGVLGRETACLHGSIENCGALAIATPGSSEPHALEGFNGVHRDLTVSPDGLLALSSTPFTGDDRENQSQIVKINLATADAQMLTDIANYGQWRDPKFSPSGKSVAWTFYDQKTPGSAFLYIYNENANPAEKLRCSDTLNFHWLSDDRLAVECEHQLVIVDVNGRRLANIAIPRT